MIACFFRKKQAVTLIELMLVTLLIMLIFAGGIAATITMMEFFQAERAEIFVTDNLANAFEWIRKDAMGAFSADVSIDNEVTFFRYYTGMAGGTHVASTRYYVIGNDLFRQDSSPASTKLITDMIDTSSLPVFATPTPDKNYIRAEVWVIEPDHAQAHSHFWIGAMLRCKGPGN
jgi:type II secretory pathway pseudopilin PulG